MRVLAVVWMREVVLLREQSVSRGWRGVVIEVGL